MNYTKYEVRIYENGDVEWYLNNKRHRENGPAVEWINGEKFWYLNNKLHRENGPACEYADDNKIWYFNGKLHCEDGPAIEYADDSKFWYLNGTELTEKEFNQRNSSYSGKVVEIDGKKYKLNEV